MTVVLQIDLKKVIYKIAGILIEIVREIGTATEKSEMTAKKNAKKLSAKKNYLENK